MKNFLKRLFCWHEWDFKIIFTPRYIIHKKCKRCGSETTSRNKIW